MFRKTLALVLTGALYFAGTNAMLAEIQMIVGDETFPVMLEENDAAKDLMKRLPLSLVFENYGSLERISYLKEKLGELPIA